MQSGSSEWKIHESVGKCILRQRPLNFVSEEVPNKKEGKVTKSSNYPRRILNIQEPGT